MNKNPLSAWPAWRQLTGADSFGRGAAVQSRVSKELRARTSRADRVVGSVCPYCAVGCAQNVYVEDGRVTQIEGDADSPVSRGRLCPKGSATLQLTTGAAREKQVLYRPPYGADWEPLDLPTALDMVAERVIKTRRETFVWEEQGARVRRTLGIASLGGATLDNEENYLIKKLWTSLGVVQVENQARLCHSSTVAALGTSFGRGGATTFPGDLQHSDLIVIQGSNMAEAHPVAFQWVMEAKGRGARVVHIDPRFSRTSALADMFIPTRAGTDIVLLGGVINHVLQNERWFRDYVLAYTNASTIVSADFEDTEDLDGVFSGLDREGRKYDPTSWQYDGAQVNAAVGERDTRQTHYSQQHEAGGSESHGAGGPTTAQNPKRDETLQNPRCVFQILKRHYSRYTPEMVSELCGVPEETFAELCELFCENSGRDRTGAFVYAVGWTQHTVGVQYIRTACILQLLLGNIGRPGGGVMAMRGHASIQGSSDIPTLFNLLPGYIPMPHAYTPRGAGEHQTLDDFIDADKSTRGHWNHMRAYMVSLLKAWWGDAAQPENDFCFDYLPRITGDHSTYATVVDQIEGRCKGYFLMGENPTVGSANSSFQRQGMAELEWLVVRDLQMIESATWWKDGPEIESGEMQTDQIGTEVFFFPAAAHIEKEGTFTNTQRMLQWHSTAREPIGDARSDLWFMFHLGRLIREKLAGSTDEMDRPLLDLTWSYPTAGEIEEPSAEAVLAEINGHGTSGEHLSSFEELKDDGSTSSGCWIYCGVFADGVNLAKRRTPKEQQNWVGAEWGWAWPANRRVLYNRASADPAGEPWSPNKALIWWDAQAGSWIGHDVPDFQVDKAPDYMPPEGATGPAALSGTQPFTLQDDGLGWLFAPAGLTDGPLPTHYEPQDSPFQNGLYGQQRNPVRKLINQPRNRYHPGPGEPGVGVFPFVVTTYRLTEHFTAGGMSRWTPYLSELQPEFFVEVSPELAGMRRLEHAGWATIVTARNAIEARVMVTDRLRPLTVQGRTIHQIGMPYHWGPNGLSRGDAFNELSSVAMDPNAHIQEVKALSADIQPGRRPRGAERVQLVREYCERAGVNAATGTEL